MKAQVIILESEAYEQLKNELLSVTKEAVRVALAEVMEERGLYTDWIKKEEAMKLLGIRSKGKLQELRDRGEIVFSQRPGGKTILYSRSSIQEYLEKNTKLKF